MELSHQALVRRVDDASLPFETTASLEPLREGLGQDRALAALDFAVSMRFEGYNVYALGASQTGKQSLIMNRLDAVALTEARPDDWCYVNDFDDPGKPRALRLPTGTGTKLKNDVAQLVADARALVPAALESEEYLQQSRALTDAFQRRQLGDAEALQTEAQTRGLAMLTTPNGFVFAPARDGRVIDAEEFNKASEEERQRVAADIDHMNKRLIERLQDFPQRQQDLLRAQRELAERTTAAVLEDLMRGIRRRYQLYPDVLAYFVSMERDLNTHAPLLAAGSDATLRGPEGTMIPVERILNRYSVNLIVDSAPLEGLPVVYESNPSLENLVGRVEHRFEYGNPVTDFSLIRPGALHRANGGYLVLDVDRVLAKPFAWEALKRALFDKSVRIESVSQLMNLSYSVSLDPAPIPLEVKVVLLGTRRLYHLLRDYESDFESLFKVVADFDDDIELDAASTLAYARVLAGLVAEEGIRHLDRGAVARTIEHGGRLVSDQRRVSTHLREMADLLREADFVAGQAGAPVVTGAHVEKAIDDRAYRLDRIREEVHESIRRGITHIDTAGARIGQINGLSVLQIGDLRFGQPSRITATARLGRGEVIDIERESKLGGNIHSKAVMIVASFIGARYARDKPLSLHGSLVFEQSYMGVEGDSASVAEVCALLSAMVDAPIRQDLAVTGSMDQYGQVQAIGGVNEKIEGFFDVCSSAGLTGDQGVVIPAANRDHLMLRREVVDAVEADRFHVYAVADVDEALALLFAPLTAEAVDTMIRKRVDELFELARRATKEERDE